MKTVFTLFFSLGSAICGFAYSDGTDPPDRKALRNLTTKERNERVRLLESRLEELRAMDLGSLNGVEKREVREELKEIKKELRVHAISGGVYISVGSLLIILLLLLILL